MANIEILTKEQAIERGWEFDVGTVPDSGVLGKERVWREDFNTSLEVTGTTRYSTYDQPNVTLERKWDYAADSGSIFAYNRDKQSCTTWNGDTENIRYSQMNDGSPRAILSKAAWDDLRGYLNGCYLLMPVGSHFWITGITLNPELSQLADSFRNALLYTRVSSPTEVRVTIYAYPKDYRRGAYPQDEHIILNERRVVAASDPNIDGSNILAVLWYRSIDLEKTQFAIRLEAISSAGWEDLRFDHFELGKV